MHKLQASGTHIHFQLLKRDSFISLFSSVCVSICVYRYVYSYLYMYVVSVYICCCCLLIFKYTYSSKGRILIGLVWIACLSQKLGGRANQTVLKLNYNQSWNRKTELLEEKVALPNNGWTDQTSEDKHHTYVWKTGHELVVGKR